MEGGRIGRPPAVLAGARRLPKANVQTAATVLGDAPISRTTVIADAGVIVFREGLEAVLILAAITASFTGARRRLRRPVLVGGLVGLLATVVTYLLAETIVAAVGNGGLRLQAITGLLAIAVLMLVTNWFFHRVHWSQWIGRFNRRRKMLERVDRLGFVSGQALGFVLLGLTSVYREGFETVLFLQNLRASAGTGAVILGVGRPGRHHRRRADDVRARAQAAPPSGTRGRPSPASSGDESRCSCGLRSGQGRARP